MSGVAALIADMVRQGVDPDLIGRTAAAFAERAADAQADRRRAKDRERKALKAAEILRNSAESAESAEQQRKSPEPSKKISPIPPLKGGTFPTELVEPQPEKPKAERAKPLSAWVSEIWEITPRPGRERSGRPSLETALKAAIRRGADPATVKAGTAGYYASPDATKNQGQYAQGVHTVISSGRWETFADSEPEPPPDDDPWRRRLLNWRANQYWNSEWGPKPGKPGYQGPQTESLAA